MPIQICPAPPPLFRRIGLAIGYWEPMALTDVTRSPGCMVNLGFSLPAFGKTAQGTAKKDEKQVNGAFYHVHWYKYPLTYWLNIITSLGCLEGGDMDIAYLSEIDPTWTDSSLTTILNPEAVIFANPIAQGACAADAIASAFNMPLDVLFWCAGSQGSMYPFNGWVSNESSPLQSSLLVSERMAFKLHRQGMIMETIGKNNAVCNEYPSPILPKERWRYQMVNMYPDSGQCHPFGRSVTRWETGKNPPNTKKNFGYRAEDRMERLVLVACLLAVIPALNLATSDAAAVAGLVMTVLTVGLVSCAGKLLSRFWPGDFFPTFYACHLAVLGVLAL